MAKPLNYQYQIINYDATSNIKESESCYILSYRHGNHILEYCLFKKGGKYHKLDID